MTNESPKQTGLASEQIFSKIEENMEAGGVRDLWINLRSELDDGGPQAVESYLKAEYDRRKAIVGTALDALSNQFREMS